MRNGKAMFAGLSREQLEELVMGRGLGGKLPIELADGPPMELFGNVILVEGYDLPSYLHSGTFVGCHALVSLRDQPGVTVAVISESHRLQTLLESALNSGHLIAFRGRKLANPPTPLGGTWAVDVYGIFDVILYGWL